MLVENVLHVWRDGYIARVDCMFRSVTNEPVSGIHTYTALDIYIYIYLYDYISPRNCVMFLSIREFWLNYVMDQAGPAPASDVGGMVSFDGKRLTRSGFVGHRRMVEREHPLELDLLSMGLDLLPECLQRWLKAKVREF